jgi:hypothetical protein
MRGAFAELNRVSHLLRLHKLSKLGKMYFNTGTLQ